MKWLIALVVFAAIFVYLGFYSPDPFFQDYSGRSGYFAGQDLCPQLVVHNPYAPDSSEYQGYAWALKNPNTPCYADGSSFSAGCKTYASQVAALEQCITANSLKNQ